MFRHVPECSGMFHVPGFIDAQEEISLSNSGFMLSAFRNQDVFIQRSDIN